VGKLIVKAARETEEGDAGTGWKIARRGLPDAKIDSAIQGTASAIFSTTAVLRAGSRLYVHEKVFDAW